MLVKVFVDEAIFSKAEQVAKDNKMETNGLVEKALEHYLLHLNEIKLRSQQEQRLERQSKLGLRWFLGFCALIILIMIALPILPHGDVDQNMSWADIVLLLFISTSVFGSIAAVFIWLMASDNLHSLHRRAVHSRKGGAPCTRAESPLILATLTTAMVNRQRSLPLVTTCFGEHHSCVWKRNLVMVKND